VSIKPIRMSVYMHQIVVRNGVFAVWAIHLWRPRSGRVGQAQVDACGWGSAPCECPQKLEPTDVILSSSSHAKKLAFFVPEFRLPTEW